MFKKLREKISGWSKKVSEEAETEETPEEIIEEKEETKEKEPEEQIKEETEDEEEKKENLEETVKQETGDEEKAEIQKESQEKSRDKEKTSEKKETEKTKQIEVPKKFNIGTQQFEPDIDKIKEKTKELETKNISETKTKEKEDIVTKEPKKESEEIQKEDSEQKKQKKGFFQRFSTGKVKISEKEFDEYAEELELILLENNVALETTEKIIQELKEKITQEEIPKKEVETKIHEALKETIKEVLSDPYDIEEKIKEKSKSETGKEPYIVLFCGINGTGKTTTIAKIAYRLKQKNISSIIAAGDTFRAASIEQLKKHGDNLDIKVISNTYGSDPASVGFDAINNAKKNNTDCVLIDTAGRMHTDKNLLKEIEKISRVCKPDLKVFVGESITGNDSIEQIKAFDETIGIDAIILSKADIDEKGGTALSLGHLIKKPILYLGTGQNYEDIEIFDKEKFLEKLGL